MCLEQLGWKSTFEAAFSHYRGEGFDPARVVAEHRDLFEIAGAFGVCAGETTGRVRHRATSREDLPVVGDWVAAAVRPEEGRARIHGVLPRATALVRKEAGDTTTAQVLAANVDTVFLVTSLNQDFNPRRIERTLALIWESGARPVLVLNKADLCADPEAMREDAQAVAIGVPVLTVSALTGAGVDEIQAHLGAGVTGVLLGSSGAGKSTIVNRLLGEETLAVQQIRSHDGRGRHTTTHRQLISLPRGGMLIDTPGLREVGLWLADSGLDRTFSDIAETAGSCRFRDCRHETEPGCAVRAALETGALDPGRYESYLKLERELAHIARQQDRRLKMQEVRRWKQITMQWRRRKKIEGR